jgi:3-isopropylmalate/(R)-2-methylmalate dehydratase small subunit
LRHARGAGISRLQGETHATIHHSHRHCRAVADSEYRYGYFGITAVIAPSFADIFYNNCFKNGILPVVLPRADVDTLIQHAGSSTNAITVDLPSQTVKAGNHEFQFTLDPFRKHCLMNGLDDIGLTLEKADAISAYEAKLKADQPWMIAQ